MDEVSTCFLEKTATTNDAPQIYWTLEVLGQSFNLPIDDYTITAKTIKVYNSWLVDKPYAITLSYEAFLLQIFEHYSLIFASKRVEGKSLSSSQQNRHIELCKLAIQSIDKCIKTNAEMFGKETWIRILKILLGSTDYILKEDTDKYITDGLGESILWTLFSCWLLSGVIDAEMWSRLKNMFSKWVLRMQSVVQWNVLMFGLTQRVSKLLTNEGNNSTRTHVEFQL